MVSGTVSAPAKTITRAEAAQFAEKCAQVLVEKFGVRRVIPFGSVVGDSPWHSRSDIDLAVEGLAPEEHIKALITLDKLLPPGLELDLIRLESAWPEMRARILGEVKMPRDNLAALEFEIEVELKNLQRVTFKVADYLARTGDEDEAEQITIAKHLHDFYNGVERIFERIAVRLDGDLPSGGHWHSLLLERMAAPFSDVRPAAIDFWLQNHLQELLKFRHLFRHTYGEDLEWPRVKVLAEELPELMERVRRALEAFQEAI